MDVSLTKVIRGWKYSCGELKQSAKKFELNSFDYKKRYHSYDGLPAHPERIYQSDWISYNDFFEIPYFVSYKQLKTIVQSEKSIDRILQKTYQHPY